MDWTGLHWTGLDSQKRQKKVNKPPEAKLSIHRAAACDVTGGVASLNFDATELQIF